MESIITIFQHPIINNQIFGNGIFNFQITQSMAGVVKSMDSAMKSMNLEKISGLMDKFESQFEDFDVQSSYIEGRCHRQQQCPLHRVRLIVQLCKSPTKQGL